MDVVNVVLSISAGLCLGVAVAAIAFGRRWRTRLAQERSEISEVGLLLAVSQRKLRKAFETVSSLALRQSSFAIVESPEAPLMTMAKAQPLYDSLAALATQIRELSAGCMACGLSPTEQEPSEELKLLTALVPSEPGRWGKIQLDRVLEHLGLSEDEQVVQRGDDVVDAWIQLPTGKWLAVNARVPLDAFLASLSISSGERRAAKLAEFARQVERFAEHLGSESYRNSLAKPAEAVLLFMPGEIFFASALEQQPEIIEHGSKLGVAFVTPGTLLGLLRGVGSAWSRDRILTNLQRVRAESGEIRNQVALLDDVFERLSDGLRGALGALAEGRELVNEEIQPTAERLLGVAGGQSTPPVPSPLENGKLDSTNVEETVANESSKEIAAASGSSPREDQPPAVSAVEPQLPNARTETLIPVSSSDAKADRPRVAAGGESPKPSPELRVVGSSNGEATDSPVERDPPGSS